MIGFLRRRTPDRPTWDEPSVESSPTVEEYLHDIHTEITDLRLILVRMMDATLAAASDTAQIRAAFPQTLAALQAQTDVIEGIAKVSLASLLPTAQPWPRDVVARYQTVAGGQIDIRDVTDPTHDTDRYHAGCGACATESTTFYGGDSLPVQARSYWALGEARAWAQKHAETCRALPKPEAVSLNGSRS